MVSVSRRPCDISHPKLEEYIVEDFMMIQSCKDMTLVSSVQARVISACRKRITTTSHTILRCTLRKQSAQSVSLYSYMSAERVQMKTQISFGRRQRQRQNEI